MKLDTNKLTNTPLEITEKMFDVPGFEVALATKKLELLKALKERNISSVTINGKVIAIDNEITKIEGQQQRSSDTQIIQKIEKNLEKNLPTENSTPREFMAYMKSHEKDF